MRPPQPRAERALDALSFFASDARYGLGAYLGVYLLTEQGWSPAEIGLAASFGGLAGLLAQTPLGALVDAVRAKRGLMAGAVALVTLTSCVIPLAPGFWTVAAAGVVGALAGVTIGPTLAAISLGVVGPDRFARRHGRNEALFHAGDGFLSLVVLLLAPLLGSPVLFVSMVVTAFLTAGSAAALPARAIDLRVARGLEPGGKASGDPSRWDVLLRSRPLVVFALCGGFFHLANASMLGLVGQKLALENPGQGLALTAASAIVAQAVMVPVAAFAGARADRWGRKPLLLLAFLALAARGALYSVAEGRFWTIAVQLLDGLAAGLLGALFAVVIADLTRGTGHFAAAQGAVGTAHGLGAVLSLGLAGVVAERAGYDAAFLTMSGVALVGAALFAWLMPETRKTSSGAAADRA